jgi:hypothetical protein
VLSGAVKAWERGIIVPILVGPVARIAESASAFGGIRDSSHYSQLADAVAAFQKESI